jgi:hypothetical protein
VQPVGLFVKVWGQTVARDKVLQRVATVKAAILLTDPLLVEDEVVLVEQVKEGERVLCTFSTIIMTTVAYLKADLNKLNFRDYPRVNGKWFDRTPESILGSF